MKTTNANQEVLDSAEELFFQNRFKEAAEVLNKIPKGSEEYSLSLLMKSIALAYDGNREESFRIFKKYVDMEFVSIRKVDDFEYPMMYALAFFVRQDFQKAIENFNESLKLKPNQGNTLYFKAASLAYLGNVKKAIDVIDEAIELDSENIEYWNLKGEFLTDLNHAAEAHKVFDRAIKISDNSGSWSGKGILHYCNDDIDKALHCFDRAIRLDSTDIIPIVYKAAIYSELKDYETAEEYFDMAENIDCSDINYLIERAKHLINKNEFKKSIHYLDESLRIDDGLAISWMYKSIALSELGRDSESEFCFKKAMDLDPDSLSVFDDFIIIEE